MSAVLNILPVLIVAILLAGTLYHKALGSKLRMAILSGVLLALSFPRAGLFPLAWFALVPLLLALRGVTLKQAAALGFVSGLTFFGVLLYWVSIFGLLPWILLSAFQAIYVMLFAMAVAPRIEHRTIGVLVAAFTWAGLEWLRSLGPFGFTWGSLAVSQVRWTGVLQLAGILSGSWITLIIVITNAAVADLVARRDRRSAVAFGMVAATVATVAVGGQLAVRPPSGHTRVAVVQGGVPLTWPDKDTTRRIRDAYWPMTRSLAGKADLVIWPESAMPDDLLASPRLQAEMGQLARTGGFDLLAGGAHAIADPNAAGGVREYNGAYLFDRSGRLVGRRNKVRLVPFGEYVPGRSWLPFVDRYPVLPFDRYPGHGLQLIGADEDDLCVLGVMICFESIFSDTARRMAESGARVPVIITNDSWFGDTAAVEQHRDFAILRAVETHRYVVRAGTTGVSCIISPCGQVMADAGLGKRAIVSASIGGKSGCAFPSRAEGMEGSFLAIALLWFVLPVFSRRPRAPTT